MFNKFRFNRLSILFALFLVTLLITITFLIVYEIEKRREIRIAAEEKASLELSPASGTFYLDQPFEVDIILDTGTYQVDGVDVVLNFDPTVLEATALSEGTISQFTSYPLKIIDQTEGKIRLSAVVEAQESPLPVTGSDLLVGTITFRPTRVTAATLVNFEFQEGERNDTNVGEYLKYEDILGQVKNASFEIATPPTSTPIPTPGKPADLGISYSLPGSCRPKTKIVFSVKGLTLGREIIYEDDNPPMVDISSLQVGQAYDFILRGPSHLSVKKTLTLSAGSNRLDFGLLPSGDIAPRGNRDDYINTLDYSVLVSEWNISETPKDSLGDFNCDLFVNSIDYSIMINNFNKKGGA